MKWKLFVGVMVLLFIGILFSQFTSNTLKPNKFKGFIKVNMEMASSKGGNKKLTFNCRIGIDDSRLILDSIFSQGPFMTPDQDSMMLTAKLVIDTTSGKISAGMGLPNNQPKMAFSMNMLHAFNTLYATKSMQENLDLVLHPPKEFKDTIRDIIKKLKLKVTQGKPKVINGLVCEVLEFKGPYITLEYYYTRDLSVALPGYHAMLGDLGTAIDSITAQLGGMVQEEVLKQLSIDLGKTLKNSIPVRVVFYSKDSKVLGNILQNRNSPKKVKPKLDKSEENETNLTINLTYQSKERLEDGLFSFEDYNTVNVSKSMVEKQLKELPLNGK